VVAPPTFDILATEYCDPFHIRKEARADAIQSIISTAKTSIDAAGLKTETAAFTTRSEKEAIKAERNHRIGDSDFNRKDMDAKRTYRRVLNKTIYLSVAPLQPPTYSISQRSPWQNCSQPKMAAYLFCPTS
jgi:hypothetical protein